MCSQPQTTTQVAQNIKELTAGIKEIQESDATPSPLSDFKEAGIISDDQSVDDPMGIYEYLLLPLTVALFDAKKFVELFKKQYNANYSRWERINFTIVRHRVSVLTGASYFLVVCVYLKFMQVILIPFAMRLC